MRDRDYEIRLFCTIFKKIFGHTTHRAWHILATLILSYRTGLSNEYSCIYFPLFLRARAIHSEHNLNLDATADRALYAAVQTSAMHFSYGINAKENKRTQVRS